MARRNRSFTALLAADAVLASIPAINIDSGHLSIQVLIDSGVSGVAPTDTPAGVWELWISNDEINFSQYTTAAVVAELALIAPNGNNLVSAYAVFANVPGMVVKVRYNQTSGGGSGARATVNVTT